MNIMKTQNFTLIAAGLAVLSLASCSEEEPVSVNNGRAIDFRAAMDTRAVETTNANLRDINLAAFMGEKVFFPTMDFTRQSDGFFTSTQSYYWPGDDTELSFYAYAPANPGGTVTLTPDTKTVSDFSPAAELGDQVDFITANATGRKSLNETGGVPLTFNHQLVQIEVYAKTENTLYKYNVTGVRIGQPVSKGTFDFTSSAWTLGTDKAVYTDTYDTPVTLSADPVSVMGNGGNAMILPQQLVAWDPVGDKANTAKGAYLSIRLQISTAETGVQVYPFPSDANCVWASIPIDTNWEAGHKYIYTLDLTSGAGFVDPDDPKPGTPVLGGPIKFTVDVTEWIDTPIDKPMTIK